MKRRNFILLSTGGVAALAIPTWYNLYGPFDYNPLLVEPELLSYIWDNNTISEIGQNYRQLFPNENTERRLVSLLTEHISSDSISFNEEVNNQIQEDYKDGRIVMLDGWLLSVTEARQCALFSLTQPN